MIISWHEVVEYFGDRAEVEEFLMDRSARWSNPAGTMAMSYWLGPGTREQADLLSIEGRPDARLRIDLEPTAGFGAATWFGDDGNFLAVEPGYGRRGFGTWIGSFEPVPLNVGRVSFMTALRLAFAYAETGERPTVKLSLGELSWVEDPYPNSLLAGTLIPVSNPHLRKS
jgi:hypothetical protein